MTNQTQTIAWRRLLSDGAVIVVSILLALWADAWWDNFKEHREEQELLGALQVEFRNNQENVTEHIEQVLVASKGCRAISQMTEAQLASELNGENLVWLIRPYTAEFQSGAIQAALGTERGGLIRSSDLLLALSQYQASLADLDSVETSLEQLGLDAHMALGLRPESHRELKAICGAKFAIWDVYQGLLSQLRERMTSILGQLEDQIS